jgi:hypothetical protein
VSTTSFAPAPVSFTSRAPSTSTLAGGCSKRTSSIFVPSSARRITDTRSS